MAEDSALPKSEELETSRKGPYRVLQLKPNPGEMLKPAETIDVVGTEGLSLQDRLVFNRLLSNAHGETMGIEGTDFKIPMVALRGSHLSNDRLIKSIEKLMRTIVVYRRGDTTSRFQMLGGNDLGSSDREHGTLTYSFDKRMVALVKDSVMFGKLEINVQDAFTSKYALAIYEYVARRVYLKHKFMEDQTVDDLRRILGVDEGKLKAFGNLRQKALEPALAEINALADFNVSIIPRRTGRRITHVTVMWHRKNLEDRQAAYQELQRPKVGRKARINGLAEQVVLEDGKDFETISNDIDGDLFGEGMAFKPGRYL